MDIRTMQERHVTDKEIDRHLEDLVGANGKGVLGLVRERAEYCATLGGPHFVANSLRLAVAAAKKMKEVV
jgi:hypothetical protein